MPVFIRKPFSVDATEITLENIAEIAEKIGELKHKPDGEPFIVVDRTKIPALRNVYTGFWITFKEKNIRCYSPRYFKEQFTPIDQSVLEWMDYLGTNASWDEFEEAQRASANQEPVAAEVD